MRCKTAKEFLRPMAIEHYITNRNSNLFIFMSLYSDEEPYPIEDLLKYKNRVQRCLWRILTACRLSF